MVNYTKEVADVVNLTDTVSLKVIRNPNVVIALVWLMIFVLAFLSFVFIFQKFLESVIEEKESKITKRYLIVLIILGLILFILVHIARTYGHINLLKPIADYFGIPYQ